MRGAGRAAFAAVILLIVGALNIIYGIGALDNASFYANGTRYILDNLNTMGWVLIILGVIQLTGGFSLLSGNTYGRVIGIIGGSIGAIGALLSIDGIHPGGRWGSSSSAAGWSGASSSTARRRRASEPGAGPAGGLRAPGRRFGGRPGLSSRCRS